MILSRTLASVSVASTAMVAVPSVPATENSAALTDAVFASVAEATVPAVVTLIEKVCEVADVGREKTLTSVILVGCEAMATTGSPTPFTSTSWYFSNSATYGSTMTTASRGSRTS